MHGVLHTSLMMWSKNGLCPQKFSDSFLVDQGEASNAGVTLRVARDVPKAKRFSAYEPDADGPEAAQQAGEDGIKEDVQNGLGNQAHENAVQNGGENGIIEAS